MNKKCDLCGNKLTLYKLNFKDGAICSKCLIKYKFGTKWRLKVLPVNWALKHNISDLKELVSEGKTIDDLDLSAYAPSKSKKQSSGKSLHDVALENSIASANKKLKNLDIPENLKHQLTESKSFDFFGVKKELKYLPQIVDLDSEKLVYACSGILNSHTWLIVCTNKRVIFLNKNMIYGMQQKVIPLSAINAVTFTQKLALGTISITNGANVTTIESVNKMAAPIMSEKIQEAKNDLLNPHPQKSSDNDLDDLRKLKSLLDDNIITQDEFVAKKRQILGL